MATFGEDVKMKHCTQCPYKTASEEHMHSHILNRECPNGSFSYRVER